MLRHSEDMGGYCTIGMWTEHELYGSVILIIRTFGITKQDKLKRWLFLYAIFSR